MSNKVIKSRYQSMIAKHESKPDRERINCYQCADCKAVVRTIDIDTGTTPMFNKCDVCGGRSSSTFYIDKFPEVPITYEWYRPTLEQVLKQKGNHNYIDHILNGGLSLREKEVKLRLIEFEARCILQLKHSERSAEKPQHLSTKYNLVVSDNLEKKVYLNDNGMVTAAGSKVLTNVFLQGLIGNVFQSHEAGFRDQKEHIEFIIEEIRRSADKVVSIEAGEFDPDPASCEHKFKIDTEAGLFCTECKTVIP